MGMLANSLQARESGVGENMRVESDMTISKKLERKAGDFGNESVMTSVLAEIFSHDRAG
jgi:hypothetical protein